MTIKRVLRNIDRLSRWSGQAAFYLMLVLLVLVVWGVITRYLLNAPSKWSSELSQFVFGACFLLAGAVTFLEDGHVRVDSAVRLLPPKARKILELVVSLFFWLFIFVFLYQGGVTAWDAVRVKETSGTFWNPPVWPLKIVIPLSALMLLLQGVGKFIRDWQALTKGKKGD